METQRRYPLIGVTLPPQLTSWLDPDVIGAMAKGAERLLPRGCGGLGALVHYTSVAGGYAGAGQTHTATRNTG